MEDRPMDAPPAPPAVRDLGTMAEYKEMVARAEPVESDEGCPEFWEKADGEIAGFLSDLVQRYDPEQPVGEEPAAYTRKMRWVDAVD